jgi:hypothetical protein
MWVGGQLQAPDALPPGNDPVPIIQGVGWTPGALWTGAENLAPHTLIFVKQKTFKILKSKVNVTNFRCLFVTD